MHSDTRRLLNFSANNIPPVEYAVIGRGLFQLTAARDGHVVVYSSDQSLMQFVGNAQIVLERARP